MKFHNRLLAAGVFVLASATTVISEGAASAANPLAGKPCYSLGSTTIVNYIKYTCIQKTVTTVVKGKKVTTKTLVYDAGVQQPIPPSLPTGNFDTSPGALIWSETFTGAAGSPINNAAQDATTKATVTNFNLYWTPVTGSGTYGTGEIENNTNSATNLALDGTGALNLNAVCIGSNGASSVVNGVTKYTSPTDCRSSSQTMGRTWTSARIWTENKVNFQYGQLEARIWMPTGSYNWPAFWMMGQSFANKDTNPLAGWPYCGELDIAEGLQGNYQDQATIHSNIPGTSNDWGYGLGLTQVAPLTQASMTGGWHNYGILWKPNSITFILDGKAWAMDTYDPTTKQVTQTQVINGVASSTSMGPGTANGSIGGNWPFNAPFFIILNDAIGGASSPVAPSNSTTSTMKIGWVKYYLYNGYGTVTLAH